METKSILILRIRKCQLKFLGHLKSKEILTNQTLTAHDQGKRDRGKHKLTHITRLCILMIGGEIGVTLKI